MRPPRDANALGNTHSDMIAQPVPKQVCRHIRGFQPLSPWSIVFFFQAEDGIRDKLVTGVQTCALPISPAVPLTWRVPAGQSQTIELKGIESRRTLSPISGDVRIEWTGKPVTARVPYRDANEAETSVARPGAYWIPAAWSDVIAMLDLHGIPYERITSPREVDVTMDRFSDPKFASTQFEGHVRVTATATAERRRERFPAGSVRVSTDQPLGTLAVIMLEPSSPDSLFQWGWFHSILSPTEYVESYIMEPMAERMLAEDPKLAEEFRKKLEGDAEFRGSSRARLQWLYQRTPFYDERARLYPVGREF